MFLLAGNALLLILIISSGISTISQQNKNSPEKLTQITLISPIISPTVTPSSTPIPTFAPSPTPTLISTPTPEAKPTSIPDSIEKSESNIPANTSGNLGLSLMQQINNFRSGKGLAALSTDGYTCAFATLRAGEIINAFNHDGFRSRIDSNSLPYPSYSNVAENIAMNSDPNAVVQGWIDSPEHNENMSRDVPYGCVGSSGNYYVFEAWKP